MLYFHSGQFRVENWKLLLACALVRVFLRLFMKKKFSGQEVVKLHCRYGLNSFICHIVALQLVEKSVQISSHLLICVCTFLLLYKIVLTFADA